LSKRENEKAIFSAFLRAAPDFVGEEIADWKQPTDENDFPDIVCKSKTGNRVGVELGEWLNEDQMRSAKGMERTQQSILEAIGGQGKNTTENIFCVWLLPAVRARIKPADATQFRTELFQMIEEVDQRWPDERFWHGPRGFRASGDELAPYAILQKYLNGIHFFPSDRYEGWPPDGRKVKRQWFEGQPWILFPARGGSYSKDTMLQPLLELLAEKKEHYSSAGTGFHHLTLMIYYNSALIYNSPAETPTFTFEDAVREARTFIGDDPDPFTSIYLFLAIDEGRVLKIV
jgi:hypothetical protein